MPSPRRLLLISYDFPPEIAGARRVVKFCEHLPAHGIQPTVLTTKPFAATGYDPAPLIDLAERGTEIIRVESGDLFFQRHRLPSDWTPETDMPSRLAPSAPPAWASGNQKSDGTRWLARQARRWFAFPDDRSRWIAPAYKAAEKWLKANPGAAYMTTSFPHSTHLVGLKLKKRFPNASWVADFRDGWTQNGEFFDPPTPWHKLRHLKAEAAVATYAHMVFAVSEPIARHLEKAGNRPERTTPVIYNGFDEDDMERARADAEAIRARRSAIDPPTIVYTGTLFGDRSIEPLLRAIAQLKSEGRPCRLELYSRLRPSEFRLLRQLEIEDRVQVRGFVPHTQALAAQAAADLLFLTIAPGPSANIMMTQKVFEYLGARRSILALTPPESACARLLDQLGCSYQAKPGNPHQLVGALRDALADLFSKQPRVPDPLKAAQFSRQRQNARAAKYMGALWASG